MALLNFDSTGIAPRQTREIMPGGTYLAACTESEVGTGRNPGSVILKLEWTIQDGEFKGRKVFDNINVRNQSQQAEKIGAETLAQLAAATGRVRIGDTSEIHGVPIAIRVGVDKAQMEEDGVTEKYPAKNVVKDYLRASKYTPHASPAAFPGLPSTVATGYANLSGQGSQNVAQGAAAGWPAQPPAAAPVAPPAPAPQAAATISPDGQWRLENGGWVPNVAAAPAPAAPPVAPSFPPPPAAAPQAAAQQMPWGANPAPGTPIGGPGPWAQR